jgi:transcriptional regulator with XRE-family HTH domain
MAREDNMAEVIPVHPLELRRRRENLSREALAAKADISVRTIFGIEREGQRPSRATVRLLAEALNCRPGDIS